MTGQSVFAEGPGLGAAGEQDPVDTYLDLCLRGEAPDWAAFLAQHPGLSAEQRRRLERLQRALLPRGAPQTETREPERIDGYRLLEPLGSGGMGVVWLAEDERLGRRVALKLLRPELAQGEAARARFAREARALAALKHTHIVTLLEARLDGTPPYLVMEHVQGQSLEALLAAAKAGGRPLPIRSVLRLGAQLARALDAAHAAGVLHRDVKPSNVILAADGQAKLVDFGLAVLPSLSVLSHSGQFHGTLAYASPEQISSEGRALDGRMDVWGLGVLLYEALTGRQPFQGESAQALLAAISLQDPIPPRRLVPSVPRDAETVVLQALHKERSRRYATAAEFAADLEASLDRLPIRARPSGPLSRAWSWGRRRPREALGLATAVLAVTALPLAYAAVTAGHAREITIERDALAERTAELDRLADLQGQILRSMEPEAVGVRLLGGVRSLADQSWGRIGLDAEIRAERSGDLDRLLGALQPADLASEVLEEVLLRPALERLEHEQALSTNVRTELELTVAAGLRSLGSAQSALEATERAVALRTQSLGEGHTRTLDARRERALCLYDLGRDEEAAAELSAVQAAWEVLGPPSRHKAVEAAIERVAVLERLDELQQAEALARESLVNANGLDGRPELQEAAMNNLGQVLASLGQHAEALPLLEETLARRRKRLGAANPATLAAQSNLALLHGRLGHMERSLELLDEAHRAAEARLGARHPTTLRLANNLGASFNQAGRPESAEPLLRAVVEARLATLGGAHGDTARAMSNLGNMLRDAGRLAEAEPLLRSAAHAAREAFGTRHSTTLIALNNLSFLLEESGALEEAAEVSREVLREATALLPHGHPTLCAWSHNLAGLERRLGNSERAAELSRIAMEGARIALGPTHPHTLAFSREHARCLGDLGHFPAAIDLLEEQWVALESSRGQEEWDLYSRLCSELARTLADLWAEVEPLASEPVQSRWQQRTHP